MLCYRLNVYILDMKKPGLLERLLISYIVFVVLLVGLNMFLLYVSSRLENITSGIYLVDYRKKEAADKLMEDLISMEETTKQYMLLHQASYWPMIESKAGDISAAWKYLCSPGMPCDEEERKRLVMGRSSWEGFLSELNTHQNGFIDDTMVLDAIFFDNGRIIDELVSVARFSRSMAIKSLDQRIIGLKSLSDHIVAFTWWAFGIALSIGLIVPWIIYRSIIKDLNSIKRGIGHISDGDFAYEIPSENNDELGMLAGAFNQMASRLKELDDMKTEFVSIVSHELKTPLTSMKESANLLLEGIGGDLGERPRRLITIMDQGINRLLTMINELLEISRLEGGMVHLDLVPYDMRRIVSSFIPEIQPYADKAGVDVDVSCIDEPCMVRADLNKVVQVLTNLTHNAIKYSHRGQRVEIRIHRDDLCVFVEIEDHGMGIPKADIPLVFEKFYRSKISRGHSGTGLGLAIARRIMEAHGGGIHAESTINKGSIFSFSLPVLPGDDVSGVRGETRSS
ncbi:MAG: HAMP domain-containing sensor histidine kinase [Thermodesulfobacteriota bacterium]|nr:HAMP domain-containing sensor histidine kinase [Thermodesulfobacteriota bacterium]